jgi:hypothetical protein
MACPLTPRHLAFPFILKNAFRERILSDKEKRILLKRLFATGLPDLSGYNIPKREKIYQTTTK